MITIEQACYRAGRRMIIQPQNLNIRNGELVVILGPNGAGKSTLLGLLSGRLRPTTGTVALRGRSLQSWSAAELARCRAVMSQKTPLTFGFTAREVVALGRSAYGQDERLALIVEQALSLANIGHLADRQYPLLSGGEQQRVQFARAIAQVWDAEPSTAWLLLDEPDAGLDIAHQDMILRAAKRFSQQGFGVVAVLHNLHLAAQYADKIVLLNQGLIVRQGEPQEVLQPELLNPIYGITLCRAKSSGGGEFLVPESGL